MQYHKYSLTEIENMMPWERDIYLTLLQEYIETDYDSGFPHPNEASQKILSISS